MSRNCLLGSAAALLVLLSAPAFAMDCSIDCDTTLRQGRVFALGTATQMYGPVGDSMVVRVWVPLLLDDGGALLNNSAANIVSGRIIGGTSSFGAFPYAVLAFGTADALDLNGTYTSNDITIFESTSTAYSDTVGQLLTDGGLVWRANYAGTAQNNLEWKPLTPGQQTPNTPPNAGSPILVGPGIAPAAGSAFLGIPAAIAGGSGMYVGNTNFDSFTGNIPRGVNVWDYNKVTPSDSTVADFTYLQDDAETFANANGVPVATGNGRQTQPVLANVDGVFYVVFGINDTAFGGSARPKMFAIDAFEDNNGFTDAVALVAPTGYRFVDHQATGGGTNVYENKHFDMNSSGVIVALTEGENSDNQDPNDVPTYQILRYDPIMAGGRITGYNAPVVIADAGPLDVVADDGIVGPFYVGTPGDPNDPFEWINPLSGAGINNNGTIAFAGLYDTDEPFDPNDPNGPTRWDDAVYVYDALDRLTQVMRESDVYSGPAGDTLALGPIPREDSDAFMATGLADNADVLAINFRANRDDLTFGQSRGVAVIAINHVGDIDFDGDVDLADLASFLSGYNSVFGDPDYDPQADFDMDGDVDLGDLAALLANYGS